jgi:hypothetical protein
LAAYTAQKPLALLSFLNLATIPILTVSTEDIFATVEGGSQTCGETLNKAESGLSFPAPFLKNLMSLAGF